MRKYTNHINSSPCTRKQRLKQQMSEESISTENQDQESLTSLDSFSESTSVISSLNHKINGLMDTLDNL
jgi:hypothetical protein